MKTERMLTRQPKVRFSDCVNVCASGTELVAVEKAISETCETSIAGSAISKAEMPLSSGDPKNWSILGLCPFAPTDQRTLIESTLAIISRHPKKIYDICSFVQNPELKRGGFEISSVAFDSPQNDQNIFLESFCDFFGRVASRCSPTLETLNHYEINAALQPLFSATDYYELYGASMG
ncbi:hypothetical protein ACOME3_010529 [Neoechinorhynchus agilis]